MDLEDGLLWFLGAVVVAIIAIVIWAVATGHADCPKGQQVVQTGQTIIVGANGSVMDIPQFSCESA